METNQNRSLKMKIAKILLMITGFFPFCVGSYFYINNILIGRFNFVEHICFTNLIATGLTTMLVTHFELESKKPWVYFLLVFMFAWVGGNDTYALVRNYFHGNHLFPIAMIPTTLGAISMILISMELSND